MSGKTIATRYGLFLETERDLGRRLEGRIAELRARPSGTSTARPSPRMMLFAYMIGNTDFSIYVQHNVRLLQTPAGAVYPIPYDFDYAGLVNAPYAVPPRTLKLKSVLERNYLGPCLTIDELPPLVARFREKRADVMALVDSVEGMEAGTRREVKGYLDEFFAIVEKPKDAKRVLIDSCMKRAGM